MIIPKALTKVSSMAYKKLSKTVQPIFLHFRDFFNVDVLLGDRISNDAIQMS